MSMETQEKLSAEEIQFAKCFAEEMRELIEAELRKRFEGLSVECINETEVFGKPEVACFVGERFYEISNGKELDKINREYAYYVNARLETDVFVLEVSPLECEGDGCYAGAYVNVVFKKRVLSTVTEFYAALIANIVDVILQSSR